MNVTRTVIKEPTLKEKITLRILIILGLLSVVNFFYWFISPEYIDHKYLYGLLFGLLSFDAFRVIYMWYHYWDISVPEKPVLLDKPTVDVFTTFFPGEPYDMVKDTLLAIQRMTYPHTTYLCDEANDSHLKEFCEKNGIKHVTRENRIHAKAGNINNALKQATGEICLILDPDHIPKEEFLDEVVPYFEDQTIGFVQSVQAYYNVDESLVAKAAAEQTFHFYGPLMMSMNSYGTVNAIGANCVFRRKALDSIGGHAAGLAEDMHTAMQLYAKGWKSVYVPKIFTKGRVPATLTSYYKQQLKWSRGTLELLVSAFPKLYGNFTWRQKLHFGILPLHYLSGVVVLVTFLIPILSLFAAATPWKGNIINFSLIVAPVLASILAIRLFVQRWVMDKSEWGTHILGGLLQTCTWWVNVIGLVYTIIRKNVPYLPTPKEDTERTSWKLLIPNLLVGVISIVAVIYGLSIDFTSFSMFMSGFALVNASFMFFTLVFAFERPKPVEATFEFSRLKNSMFNLGRYAVFSAWQKAALPLVLGISVLSGGLYYHTEYIKWEGVQANIQQKNRIHYIGIFAPRYDDGITTLENVKSSSNRIEEKFDIISHYLAWDREVESSFPDALIDSVYRNQSIPMITWEPWLNEFQDEISGDDHVFNLITSGFFDEYISRFAVKLKNLERPVFLRFAHESDNPFYPWYMSGSEAASTFKEAWIHTYEIFKEKDAHNVIWIWNPWKSEHLADYYPGREYVDWIGINVLNYGEYNLDGEWHNFDSLYQPFHEELIKLPPTPVVISEFGTLRSGQRQNEWIEQAFSVIENEYTEIKSVIYFNSEVDNNWPRGLQSNEYLDWTIPQDEIMKASFNNRDVPEYVFEPLNILVTENTESYVEGGNAEEVKGINYKYGQDWRNNYHVLNRRKLLSDFGKIKNLGLNTIKISGNTVYDYNLLKISREMDLDVSFGFWIPESIDFMNDAQEADQQIESIINKIETYKNHDHITSWNIQNDVLFNQKDFFHKPELLFQNRAYVHWLRRLVSEIKRTDPIRPVILDLEVNQLTIYHARMLEKYVGGIDFYGLSVKDDHNILPVMEFFDVENIEYLFSEIDTEMLSRPEIRGPHTAFFVTSWQDQHESNKLTFDGITDRKGRVKNDYVQLLHTMQESDARSNPITARILKPATGLYANDLLDYYAMIYNGNGEWEYGQESRGYAFEWSLVKCDEYGNYLAVRDIGTRPVLTLKIPENHEYFRLLLTVSDGTTVASTITPLHTPLMDSERRLQ
ncbi:MAG: glycosyltransferase family 2 protein [Balneolaceae bacterium]